MLNVEGVTHRYQGPAGIIEALASTTFQVADGEFICIVGPSGCGKSTLLRIIAGLLLPSSGAVMLDGATVVAPQRRIGLVFQQTNLMPWRSVLDNIALPLELAGATREARDEQATSVIKHVGLDGFEKAYPAELSGGMAQRVALGRALVQNPDILLLDEPFAALDALTREQMLIELLALWSGDHKTAIMVTHDITEAVFLADRVLVMSQRPGHIRAIVNVDLPRPRRLEMIHEPGFGELVQQIRQNIGALTV
ncbi:MAG: ABC transporter ATP-binding protein [Chloroflexota bacterium]